jgi:hypothetical protein
MHIAELVVNWENSVRGFFNHWTRIAIVLAIIGEPVFLRCCCCCCCVTRRPGIDTFFYIYSPSHTISYAAHLGGISCGTQVLRPPRAQCSHRDRSQAF